MAFRESLAQEACKTARVGPMPRPSHVRDAVQGVLGDPGHHSWTVEEMLAELGRRGVTADFSSVFRGLAWCERERLAQRVELGDGRARFEALTDHHEHAQCQRCGTVVEVRGCQVDAVSRRLEKETGFRSSAHRLVFLGLCAACK